MGDVVHNEKNLEGVMVQVFENGRILRTIAANKRGKYQIDIPFNKEYTLVYRASYMIPVGIEVNTTYMNPSNENIVVEVPLKMELFKRFNMLEIESYKSPIGIVKVSTGETGVFKFYPDKKVLSEISLVNEKSRLLANQGEKPIDTENAEIRQLFFGPSVNEVETASSSDLPNKKQSVGIRDHIIDPTIDSETEKINAANAQYIQQETGYEAASKLLRNKQLNSISAKEIASDNQYEFIYKTKEIRSREMQMIENRSSDIVEARIKKQEYLADLVEGNSTYNSLKATRQVPQSRTHNDGFILSEEVIKVSVGDVSSIYKHDNYDWILFEVNYYYKGKEEITKAQYDQVKSLFN
jgi:hypothetical protein